MRGRYAPSGFLLGRVWSPPFGCRMPDCRLAPWRLSPQGLARWFGLQRRCAKRTFEARSFDFCAPPPSASADCLEDPVAAAISHPITLCRRFASAGFGLHFRPCLQSVGWLAKCWRSRPSTPSAPCRCAGPECAAVEDFTAALRPPSRRSCLFGPDSDVKHRRERCGSLNHILQAYGCRNRR